MQTTKTTPYHCAELRRSVPVIQRIEWVSGIGQDDAEPVVLAEACALAFDGLDLTTQAGSFFPCL